MSHNAYRKEKKGEKNELCIPKHPWTFSFNMFNRFVTDEKQKTKNKNKQTNKQTKQNKTKQNKTKQNKTKQNKQTNKQTKTEYQNHELGH